MQRRHRIMAVLLMIILLFGITFSYHYIAKNMHHDCSGENCEICIQLELAAAVINNVRFIPAAACLFVVLILLVSYIDILFKPVINRLTLVTLKVELDN